ncbi:Large ribosomal subunit protein mL37 [Caenorhabditis elegans]|uniref:Large ribosomal subunit protein mL37 n=1 Tax=Caenorhabditis elegans TaxID=6239 RepID=O18199_CAEEL|nr:Mitochondrial ribosomal protein l37 [Caenorhabditis elegans]CAB07691.3 Mitochondrial ribosomal protein l37 [Caenorhabditis elegans]|eukprot:NP_496850.3 Mitochondrial Ribosomal Protein, Large [Caenorhabditis elegans]
MVFRKYRAVKQWGKMDTRIFKEIYNSRNKRKMPAFEVPDAVKALGVPVFEPNEIFQLSNRKNLVEQAAKEHMENELKFTEPPQQHPLQKSHPAYIFEAAEPMSDGIAQAAVLTRSVVATGGLPDTILLNSAAKLEIDEEMVKDAILHGERYNPSLEKLPARFDPVMFWIRHPRLHGTPVIKKNNIILNNLLRHVVLGGLRTQALKQNFQVNRDSPLSVYVSGGQYFSKNALVLRAQPHLTVQSADSTVTMPWAGPIDVKAVCAEPLPDIYPISPVIDFSMDTIYNDDVLLTRRSQQQKTHIHSILWSREQDQKYPWTSEQNMANAILTTYAAAVAEATRNGATTELEKPLLVRGVQLVNGRLDLVAMQLNTLKPTSEAGNNDEKNIVWIEKGLRLYKPTPYYEQMDTVEKLDMTVFHKFVALMLGFGAPHAH